MRVHSVPSEVQIVRSDKRGGCFRGDFQKVCSEFLIPQEFTPSDSPKFDGVAERRLGIVDAAATPATIQARVISLLARSTSTDGAAVGPRRCSGSAKPSTPPLSRPNRKVSRQRLVARIASTGVTFKFFSSRHVIDGSDRRRW